MTTFTLQDLNTSNINNLPTTPEEDEAMDALAKLGGGVALKEMFAGMGQDLTAQHAPAPQPSGENPHNSQVSPEAVIDEMLFTIKQSLLLLTTVINQPKAQPEGAQESQSLQHTVALVLQQSDWFKEMLHESIDAIFDIEDYAREAVQGVVENEVESYFSNSFDPTDHFDFNDAVQDAVSDQIDDVVSDKIDEAVESYMSSATITISR